MADLKEYWEKRYRTEKSLWGGEPSQSAELFIQYMEKHGLPAGDMLDVACGYGRDAVFFAVKGFRVSGCDISDYAIEMAKKNNPDHVNYFVSDVRNPDFVQDHYDVIFGNFILHLFSESDRQKIIKNCSARLKKNGLLVFSVASVQDADYGLGKSLEKDTFINERGVVKHYYSEQGIKSEFYEFDLSDMIAIEENHTHDQPHVHKSYLVIVKKTL